MEGLEKDKGLEGINEHAEGDGKAVRMIACAVLFQTGQDEGVNKRHQGGKRHGSKGKTEETHDGEGWRFYWGMRLSDLERYREED